MFFSIYQIAVVYGKIECLSCFSMYEIAFFLRGDPGNSDTFTIWGKNGDESGLIHQFDSIRTKKYTTVGGDRNMAF